MLFTQSARGQGARASLPSGALCCLDFQFLILVCFNLVQLGLLRVFEAV